MKDIVMDLAREYCDVHLGTCLSIEEMEVLLTVYGSEQGASIPQISASLALPQIAVRKTVQSLSLLRVRPLDEASVFRNCKLTRTETPPVSGEAVRVFLTEKGSDFTLGLLRAILGVY